MLVALAIALPLGCSKRSKEAGAGGHAGTNAPSPLERPARSGSSAKDLCNRICEISGKIECAQASLCLDSCVKMMATPVCAAEVTHFLECLTNQAVEHWECDEDGVAAIKEPYCEGEQAATSTCLEREAGPP